MAIKLLNAVTATGVSQPTEVQPAKSWHTVQATMGGTVVATAVTIALEGSVDGITWFSLASHAFSGAEISAEQAMFHVADKTVPFIRLNLTALTGGTAPTVTAWYVNKD